MGKSSLKYIVTSLMILATVLCGASLNRETYEVIDVYYTADLHSHFTKNLKQYLSNIDRGESLLLDGGDMTDIQTPDDSEWASGSKIMGLTKVGHAIISEQFEEPSTGTAPVVNDMINAKYDAAIIGNHEFYGGHEDLKKLVASLNNGNVDVLSANTYYDKETLSKAGGTEDVQNMEDDGNVDRNGIRLTEPYVIKNINTKKGNVKVGIIGVTTNTINDVKELVNGKLIKTDEILLQSNPEYKGKMHMTDMVEESIRVAKELKAKENPDVIILLAHSGEEPKKPRHSGNRIQELAAKVPYVDLILASHTHIFVDKHEYMGPDGRTVVVSQSGCHSKGIGEMKINLKKRDEGWTVVDIKAQNIIFPVDKKDPEDNDAEYIQPKVFDENAFNDLKKKNPKVSIQYALMTDGEMRIPRKTIDYVVDSEYKYEEQDIVKYIYYLRFNDYNKYVDFANKYDSKSQ